MNYRFKKSYLIDEDEIDNFINERILSTSHFSEIIEIYNDGNDALRIIEDLCKNNNIDELPEFIFLDLNMPVISGTEFLEEFEKIGEKYEFLRPSTRIVILSSSINPNDFGKVSSSKYVLKYINKPLIPAYLDALVHYL